MAHYGRRPCPRCGAFVTNNALGRASHLRHCTGKLERMFARPEPVRVPIGIFRDHHCGLCRDGALPCREGNPNRCGNPHAKND